jgi:hypothetical protein
MRSYPSRVVDIIMGGVQERMRWCAMRVQCLVFLSAVMTPVTLRGSQTVRMEATPRVARGVVCRYVLSKVLKKAQLERSSELPGARGSECSDSGGGNWRGPSWPSGLRMAAGARRPISGEEPGSGSQPEGRRSCSYYRLSRADNITVC